MRAKGALLLAASALLAAACGYTLEGRGNFLPPTIRTISFPTFSNATPRVGLEQRLSGAVARELASRANLKVVARAGEGDAQLSGEIVAFTLTPTLADASGRATQYQVQIVARVSLTQLPGGKVIWKNDNFVFHEAYDVAGGGISAANYADLENRAIDAEADRFAQSLVTSILQGF